MRSVSLFGKYLLHVLTWTHSRNCKTFRKARFLRLGGARATFKLLSCSVSSSSLHSPTRDTLAEYGLNYSMCRNARAKIPAYQYVYIPQMKSLQVYARCFSKILDGELYWYCLALDFITKTVVRDIFAVNCSSISRMSFYGR